MGILDGVIQGLIQGLTEFLPVSSSGHLSLYQYFTANSGESSLFFTLMLHLGTLAAVLAAFYEDLLAMLAEAGRILSEVFTGRFVFKAGTPARKLLYMLFFACLPMILVLPLNGFVAGISGDADIIAEGVCFLATSLLLFAACKKRGGHAGVLKMRPRHALAVGVMQSAAVMPGLSRSGATAAAGMIMGFERELAVKFSFLLSIPAILGGAVFEIGDAAKGGIELPFWPLFLGMLTAAAVGYLAIKLVRRLALSGRYIVFAWYTLALGAVTVVLGVIGHFAGWGPKAVSGIAA